jgi:O-antigen ligase
MTDFPTRGTRTAWPDAADAVAAARAGFTPRASMLVGLILLLVCVPSHRVYDPSSTNIGLPDVASLLLVAVSAVRMRERFRPLGYPAVFLFGAVAVAAVLATETAADFYGSVTGLVRFLQLFVLVPACVAAAIRTRRDVTVVLGGLLVVGVFQGLVGTVQYLTHTGASFEGQPIRAVGTFGSEEIMAMSAAVGFAIVIAVAGAVALRRRKHRVLLAATAAFLLLPLLFSFSRGSLIATLVSVAVALAVYNLRLFVKLTVGLAVVGGVLLAVTAGDGSGRIADRIGSITSSVSDPDASVDGRYGLWATALNIYVDYPVTGGGIKSFAALKDTHAPLGLRFTSDTGQSGSFQLEPILSPHNEYLLVLSEQGFLGGLAFVCLMVVTSVRALRRLREKLPPRLAAVGIAVSGLAVWQTVEILYDDVNGASALLVSVVIGLAFWWGFVQRGDSLPD